MGKTITIAYSNGESDELVINDHLRDSLLAEALERLDRQATEDIYGDVLKEETDAINKQSTENEKEQKKQN